MTRWLAGIAGVLSLVWILTMTVIRAQPYENHDLKILLDQDDCALPCWMGIQPGVTMGDEAVRLLREHPWVETDSIYISPDTTRQFMWVTWRYSAARPRSVRESGYLTYSSNQTGRVSLIQVRTSIPVGDALLNLGKPAEAVINRLEHVAAYPLSDLFLQNFARCPTFWGEFTSLYLVAPEDFDRMRFRLGVSRPANLPVHTRWFCAGRS